MRVGYWSNGHRHRFAAVPDLVVEVHGMGAKGLSLLCSILPHGDVALQ